MIVPRTKLVANSRSIFRTKKTGIFEHADGRQVGGDAEREQEARCPLGLPAYAGRNHSAKHIITNPNHK
jgi:hypothetical protein